MNMKLDLKTNTFHWTGFLYELHLSKQFDIIFKTEHTHGKKLKLSLDLTVSLNLKIGPEQKLHFKPDLKYQEPTTASESTYIEFITRHEESKYPKIGPKNKSYT